MTSPEGQSVDSTTIAVGEMPEASAESIPDAVSSDVDSGQPVYLGRYVKLGLLGVGAMGEVFRVYDGRLKRSIALKMLHHRLMSNERVVSRFLEEAQIVAQLQHPNIIPVHELGQLPDGRHYFTMQEIRGTEFTTQIRAVHWASEPDQWHPGADGTTFRDLIQTFHQVCVTMAYAHSRGVIHRDLKPDNIMIGGFGDVLVVDWGLAKLIGRAEEPGFDAVESDRSQDDGFATRMGTVAGTPAYMSPEQAHGQTDLIGTASDIYTLGAILYELLGGIPPFVGSSGTKIVEKVQTSRPPSLSVDHVEEGSVEPHEMDAMDRRTRLPLALVQVCERAMQRDIADRYATAEDLAVGVRAWLDGVEKRDKALKEVEAAALILQQAVALDVKAVERWSEANGMTEREGAPSDAGWALWQEAKVAEAESGRLRRLHLRKIEGALVYDPGLKEAHMELALLQIDKLADAVAVGDIRTKELCRVGFDHHLKFLSSSLADQIRNQCEEQLADAIAAQRARRGSLVGRQQLLREVSTQVRGGARFVSLVGTAGVGKTSLALELAQELRGELDRAVFCDLTEATDVLGIVRLISAALGVRVGESDPIGRLTELLSDQSTLLVLDNLEQVVDAVGSVCQDWMLQLPALKILATSRVRLGIPAETLISLKPLSLLESVELFVRRGQAADSRFELKQSNRDQVCGLVQKLDGLPLAIELAAARLNTLSLDEIMERLAGRFQLLRSRGREAQALEGALDWSWDLLEPFEQAALSQVSIFRGGFNLAAAESVVDVSPWKDCPAMFEIVAALSDNSLLLKTPTDDGSVRYGLLESIRAYAGSKLSTPGALQDECSGPEAVGAAKKRHAIHFSRMGESDYLSQLTGFGGTARWKELFPELDNLVVAIDCGVGDPAGKCCLAALKILNMKGPVSLGIDLATQVLRVPKLPHRLKIQIEIERSKCLRISGRMDEARAVVRDSVSMLEEGDEATEVDIATVNDEASPPKEGLRLLELGNIEYRQTNFDPALRCYRMALEQFRTLGDRAGEATAIGRMGVVYGDQGRIEQAIEHHLQAINISREIGKRTHEGVSLSNLGANYRSLGQVDRAVDCYNQAIQIFRDVGDQRSEGLCFGSLGAASISTGHLEQALEYYDAALKIAQAMDDTIHESVVLGNRGLIFLDLDRLGEAGPSLQRAISLADNVIPSAAGAFRGVMAVVHARSGQFDEAFSNIELGEPQVEPEPLERIKFLTKKGEVQLLAGMEKAAEASLSQAQTLAADLEIPGESEVFTLIEKLKSLFDEPVLVDHESGERSTDTLSGSRAEDLQKEDSAAPGLSEGQDSLDYQDEIEGVRLMELGHVEREQARFDEAIDCFEQALSIFQKNGDKKGEGLVLGDLGSCAQIQGQFESAIQFYTAAIDLQQEVGNNSQAAIVIGNLASTFRNQGKNDRAEELFFRALKLHRESGNRRFEGITLGNIGNLLRARCQYERAVEHYEQAIAILREVGDSRSEGCNHGNLGTVLAKLQKNDEAEVCYRTAISICDTIFPVAAGAFRGSLGWILAERGEFTVALELFEEADAQVRTDLSEWAKLVALKGQVQHMAGQLETARATLVQAQEVTADLSVDENSEVVLALKKLEDLLAETTTDSGSGADGGSGRSIIEGDSLIEMGNIERNQSNYASANNRYAAALTLYCEREHASGEGVAHERLGSVCRIQGKHDEASHHFQESLRVCRSIGDRQQEGVSLGALATSLLDQGRFEAAIEHYELALVIHRDLGDKRGEGNILGTLGIACTAQGNLELALEHFEVALAIQVVIGDKPAQGRVHGNMANALRNAGQVRLAIEHYELALDIWRVIGDRGNEGLTRGNLGVALHRLGQPDEARVMLEEAIQICGDSVPLAVGACCGSLAQIMAEQGDMTQAHRLLERGEPVLEGYRVELGKFLCRKGVVQSLGAQTEAAQASLSQANEIAQELQVNERSELSRAIAMLQAMM